MKMITCGREETEHASRVDSWQKQRLRRLRIPSSLPPLRVSRCWCSVSKAHQLSRWFVGLNLDNAVWDATVFTKNRDRLREAEVAKEFLALVVEQARGLCHQSEKEEAHRRMFWLAEDHCVVGQGAASRDVEGRLDFYLRVRGLQPGAHAESDAQRNSGVVRTGRGVSERLEKAHFEFPQHEKSREKRFKTRKRGNRGQNLLAQPIFFSSLLGHNRIEMPPGSS